MSDTKPKKPGKHDKLIMRVTDGAGVHHYIWGDDFAAGALNDALQKLAKLEADAARQAGKTQ